MLHWAILGTGFISNTVVDAITASDGSQVDLIAGRNRSKVAEFQKRHCITRSSSYENALSDPNIDAVYIGLPNDQHHPFAIAAAQAGKAVLSEKSLTTTMDDAHSLVQAIRANGTFFVEGLMYLAHPVHRRFVELLRWPPRHTAVHLCSLRGRHSPPGEPCWARHHLQPGVLSRVAHPSGRADTTWTRCLR
jgi:predicted dehydrogenase